MDGKIYSVIYLFCKTEKDQTEMIIPLIQLFGNDCEGPLSLFAKKGISECSVNIELLFVANILAITIKDTSKWNLVDVIEEIVTKWGERFDGISLYHTGSETVLKYDMDYRPGFSLDYCSRREDYV